LPASLQHVSARSLKAPQATFGQIDKHGRGDAAEGAIYTPLVTSRNDVDEAMVLPESALHEVRAPA
jgi:hypothetical protein